MVLCSATGTRLLCSTPADSSPSRRCRPLPRDRASALTGTILAVGRTCSISAITVKFWQPLRNWLRCSLRFTRAKKVSAVVAAEIDTARAPSFSFTDSVRTDRTALVTRYLTTSSGSGRRRMSVDLIIEPRVTVSWSEFLRDTAPRSIALDGYVVGGPRWDDATLHANYDHHSGVVREATMSTAMQVYFAIKGGLMERLNGRARAYINDPDQDTSLATWLLKRHALFMGVQSHPVIGRLLTLNDRLDVTGGAFPMVLDDEVAETHAWVFDPYTTLRISGALATAGEGVMRNCVEVVHERLNRVLMGQGERRPLHQECEVLYESPYGFKIVNETGGNEARYWLYSRGMTAFVSLVSTAADGTHVYSIGKKSQYVDFPVLALMSELNRAEDAAASGDSKNESAPAWGGSDLIGGCGRARRSRLSWQEIRFVIESFFKQRKIEVVQS